MHYSAKTRRDAEVDAFLAWLVAHPDEVRRLKQAMQQEP